MCNRIEAEVRNEDKNRWSYSRVSCFDHCKYEFYLEYILKDPDLYLSEGNYYAEVGSFVHEILANIFKGELAVEKAADYFAENYENNVFYEVKQNTMTNTFNTIYQYFKDLNVDWLEDCDVVSVELEERFKLNDYDFVGYIDLLIRDKSDGRLILIDHKSSGFPFKKNGQVKKNRLKNFEWYKKQMYLYCHAIHQKYGEFPKEIAWNHFKDGGRYAKIPFDEQEYKFTIKWFLDTLESIAEEKDFVASTEYFYCFNLCNFRNSCEYKETLKKSKKRIEGQRNGL